MSAVRELVRHFAFFRRLVGYRIGVLVAFTLVTTWTEGVAIALFLPLFGGGTLTRDDVVSRWIGRGFAAIGVEATVTSVLVAIVAVSIAKGALTFLTIAYQHHLAAKITQDLRRRLVGAAVLVDYRYLLGTNTGTLITMVLGESSRAASAFLYFAQLLPHLVTIAVFFAVVLVLDWKLTILVLLVGGGGLYLLRTPVRLTKSIGDRITTDGARLTTLLIQSLQSFKYLSATAAQDRLQAPVMALIRRLTIHNYKLGILGGISHSFPQPVVALLLAGVMLWKVRAGDPLAAGFVLLIYLYRTMNEIFRLQAVWQAFVGTAAGVESVERTAADLDRHRERHGTRPPPPLENGIELRNVTFSYGEKRVLHDVSLRIDKRTMVALVGASGGGKTTIADLVTGVLKPDAGAVTVDGIDLREIDLRAWRRGIGFVPQDAPLFEDTVADNIALWSCDPRDPACLARIREAARKARCEAFIEEMPQKWLSPIGERGVRLSGGQRQRVAIARELFKSPRVLILDEATSALDAESEHEIRSTIDSLKGSMTILVIAHRLSTIKGADHVYVLQDGRVHEHGTYAELMAREGSRLRELAKLQEL